MRVSRLCNVRCYALLALLFVSCNVLHAQVIKTTPMMSPVFTGMTHVGAYQGEIYAIHRTGSIARYNARVERLPFDEPFAKASIEDIFVHRGVLVVRTDAGDYWTKNQNEPWTKSFNLSGIGSRDKRFRPMAWTKRGIETREFVNGIWQSSVVAGQSPAPARLVSFVLDGDTVLYSLIGEYANVFRMKTDGTPLPSTTPAYSAAEPLLSVASNGVVHSFSRKYVSQYRSTAAGGKEWDLVKINDTTSARIRSMSRTFDSASTTVYLFSDSLWLYKLLPDTGVSIAQVGDVPSHTNYAGSTSLGIIISSDSLATSLITVEGDTLYLEKNQYGWNMLSNLYAEIDRDPRRLNMFASRDGQRKYVSIEGDELHEKWPGLFTAFGKDSVRTAFKFLTLPSGVELEAFDHGIARRISATAITEAVFVSSSPFVRADLVPVGNEAAFIAYKKLLISSDFGRQWRSVNVPQLTVAAPFWSQVVKGRICTQGNDGRSYVVDSISDTSTTANVWFFEILGQTTVRPSGLFKDRIVRVRASSGDLELNWASTTQYTVYLVDPVSHNVDSFRVDLRDTCYFRPAFTAVVGDSLYIYHSQQNSLVSIHLEGGHRERKMHGIAGGRTFAAGDVSLADGLIQFVDHNTTQLVTVDLSALPDTITHVNDIYAPMYIEELWPNPSHGLLNVSIGRFHIADPATATLILYNLLGEVVYDLSNLLDKELAYGASQQIIVTLPALGAGNYILVLRNKGVANTNILQLTR